MAGGLGELRREASSHVDPNGFVFHLDDRIFRLVYPQQRAFYEQLFERGLIAELEAERGLVATWISDLSHADLPAGLVLEHQPIRPLTYCTEWCPSMLQDAALMTLRLASALLEHGATLQDAYPWNVLFRGARPVFVDFTSIAASDPRFLWQARGQFDAFFLRPLLLASRGLGQACRAVFQDQIAGMTLERFASLAGWPGLLRHPGILATWWFDRFVQRRASVKQRLRAFTEEQQAKGIFTDQVRGRLLRKLEGRVAGLRFPAAGKIWESYYAGIPPEVDRSRKVAAVDAVLDRLQPASVLDLGANTGVFSLMAARKGARVVALDGSEACMERLYLEAREESLPVTPLVVELLSPTPAQGFMSAQFPSLMDRAGSDIVLCLGLMHHLHVAGRQPFERIAEMLAKLTRGHLVFEYVDRDDANIELIETNREVRYDLGSVTRALERHFTGISTLDSDRPTRRLLVCERRA